VATVRWTADQVIRRLLPEGEASEWRDPSGRIVLAEVAYAPDWIGERITRLERESGARVALLTRLGDGMLPHPESVLQEGDLLHVTVHADRIDEVVSVLAHSPTAGEH
jgi:trk system potassium uptake protein TrkA